MVTVVCVRTLLWSQSHQWHYPRYSHSVQHGTPSTRTFPGTERTQEGQNEILHTTERLPEFLSKSYRHVRRRWNIRKEKTGRERFVETKDEINSILEPLTMSHTEKTPNKEKQKKAKKSIWRTKKGAKVPTRKMTEKKDEKGMVKKIKRRRRVILCKLIIFSKLTCQHLCQLSPVKTTGCKYIIAGWFCWPTRGGPAFSRP